MFGHNEFNWNQIQHFMGEGDYSWKQSKWLKGNPIKNEKI